MLFRTTHRLGDALGLLAEDIEHIQNLYLRCVFPSVIALAAGIGLCILFCCFSGTAALACFVFVALELFVVPAVSVSVNGTRQQRAKELATAQYAVYADNILGVTDWMLSGRKADFLASCEANQKELDRLENEGHSFDRKRDLAQHVVFACAIVALACWAALTFGGEQGGQANWILAFVLGFFPLTDTFAAVPAAATQASGYLDSVERLNELPLPAKGNEETGGSTATKAAAAKKNPVIEITDASFAYPGQSPIIDNVNLRLSAGEHVALLGKSGSGKTTLAHLLRGDCVPTSGSVPLAASPALN